MRPHVLTVTFATALLALMTGTTTASSKKGSSASDTSSSSEAATNGYDAIICGENGYADGSGLSYSANAWNPDGDGFQCLSIINASSSTSSGFDATWSWPSDKDKAGSSGGGGGGGGGGVHSYPHVTFSSGHLPAPLFNISALRLAAEWAYSPGSVSTAKTKINKNENEDNNNNNNKRDDVSSSSSESRSRVGVVDASGLSDVGAVANIAFDMFMDADEANATSATAAKFEMMIWIGRVGQPKPLGFSSGNASCYTQQLGSSNFTLYTGQNSRGTSVFTWVSPGDQTSFDEDIAPLLQYLWRNRLVSADARLGLVEFGSEAYHASGGSNVTFSAADFSMDVWVGTPVRYELNPPADHCKEPESPAGPQSSSDSSSGEDGEKGVGVRIGGYPGGGRGLMNVALLGGVLAGLLF